MDVLNITLPKNYFDAIWGEAVILHLKRSDVPKALKNFYKVLKPGGLMYLCVKKGKGEAYVKEKLSGGLDRFYTYFSKTELINFCKKQKFKIYHSEIWSDPHKRKDVTWIGVWARK